jgi:hypothetical protein
MSFLGVHLVNCLVDHVFFIIVVFLVSFACETKILIKYALVSECSLCLERCFESCMRGWIYLQVINACSSDISLTCVAIYA